MRGKIQGVLRTRGNPGFFNILILLQLLFYFTYNDSLVIDNCSVGWRVNVMVYRVDTFASALFLHLLHVLSARPRHLASALSSPILQGQETDWVVYFCVCVCVLSVGRACFIRCCLWIRFPWGLLSRGQGQRHGFYMVGLGRSFPHYWDLWLCPPPPSHGIFVKFDIQMCGLWCMLTAIKILY